MGAKGATRLHLTKEPTNKFAFFGRKCVFLSLVALRLNEAGHQELCSVQQ